MSRSAEQTHASVSQELVDGFNMVPPQVSCHTQEVVQGLQPGETAQGLHQLEQDGTAQGPSHDGRPSDYTTVKKSRWGPPMTASNVLSTTTMASNDLSTTNTALDVSSVSSEPVLAGTNLAGTDLAGSGADSYIFKFLTEDPRSKEYQVQVTTLFDVKVPPPSPDIITLWIRMHLQQDLMLRVLVVFAFGDGGVLSETTVAAAVVKRRRDRTF